MPLISVCIPVFNGENYIKESIDSVLNQTEKRFELVIVDNCSTDKTIEIVNGVNDKRIKLFSNVNNIGLFGNMNMCLKHAVGKYIVLLPHDDILFSSMLKVFSKKLETNSQASMVYSSYFQINSQSEKIKLFETQSADRLMTAEEAFNLFIQTSPIQCCMVRNSIFSEVGLFDKDLTLTGDIHMWCRIALKGYDIIYINSPHNSVRIHKEQTTRFIYEKGEYGKNLFECYRKIFELPSPNFETFDLRIKAVKWPIMVQIVYIFKTLVKGDIKMLIFHTNVLILIINWAGITKTIPTIISIFFELMMILPSKFLKILKASTH